MASRTSRSGSWRPWLAVGLALTILVLLVDASVKASSPGPARRLAAQGWTDAALTSVERSNLAGRDLTGFLTAGQAIASGAPTTGTSTTGTSTTGTPTSSATGAAQRVVGELGQMASIAASAAASEAHLAVPPSISGAAGLLQTCLQVRAQAAASISAAVHSVLVAPAGDQAVASSAAATIGADLQRLQVADQAYQLFAGHLAANAGVRPPPSTWLPKSGLPTDAALAVMLTSLRSQVDLAPVYGLVIEAVSTSPEALGTRGNTQVLAPGASLSTVVVVGNTGNQPISGVTVSISITPAAGVSSARNFAGPLAAGASRTVDVGALGPPLGTPVTLTVTATPQSGSAKAAVRTVVFEMPNPSSPATTTPKSGTPTTTAPLTANGSATTTTTTTTTGSAAGG